MESQGLHHSAEGRHMLLAQLLGPPPGAGEVLLDLLHGLVPGLGHEHGREHAAREADGAVQPEGARRAQRGLHQVHVGLGHDEAGDEGEADDEGIGHRSDLQCLDMNEIETRQ